MYSLVCRFCLLFQRANYAWLVLLSFLLAAGCKKRNQDEVFPSIRIDSPTIGQMFFYLNTIDINASITDDRKLESVIVEVTNAQNVRYLESKTFYPDDKTFELNYTITHDDLILPSGTYYIRIRSSDGENETTVFREIQLIEAPRILERVFIIRDIGVATAIDTLQGGILSPCITYPQSYLFGGIDSHSQQLVACGNSATSLMGFLYPEFETLNTGFPPTNENITAFYHDKIHHCYFWGTQEGNLWRTSINGTQLFATIGNAPVSRIGIHSNVIIAASEGPTGNYLYVVRNDNGVIETALPFNWEMEGMIEMTSEPNRVLLIGNENGTAHFVWLNLTTSAFNEVFNFYESSLVQSVCDGNGNDFFVVHSSGLAQYTNLMSNYTVNGNLIPAKLIFDDLQQSLWAITPNQLHRLDESGQSVVQTIAAPDIQDLWFKYNK